MNLYCKEHNGKRYRDAETKFVVGRWYIPGGYDYGAACPVDIFFANKDDADAYAKSYEMPPEMASAFPIARHDAIIAKCSKNYRDYKKRYYSDFAPEDRP